MSDRDKINAEMRSFFDDLWRKDPWHFNTSDYEQRRFANLTGLIADRRYRRGVEIGCGAGAFTRHLAPLVDRLVASDVSAEAVERARGLGLANVEFQIVNALAKGWGDEEGPLDLISFNDTIHYLGWRYTFFDVAWLAHRMFEALAPGGRLLMANTENKSGDYLLLPFLVRSYRDLFVNVGFTVEREQEFRDTNKGVEYTVLASVFTR